MPTLKLDRLVCLQDTPEWTADEVYLLIASAAVHGRAGIRVRTVGSPEWNHLFAGTRRDADVVIDANFSRDEIHVAVLLEQDGANNFARQSARAALLELVANRATVVFEGPDRRYQLEFKLT